MAQRRISGKRRSRGGRHSENNSAFLDEDTNIIQTGKCKLFVKFVYCN